jgi:hypothetical protein
MPFEHKEISFLALVTCDGSCDQISKVAYIGHVLTLTLGDRSILQSGRPVFSDISNNHSYRMGLAPPNSPVSTNQFTVDSDSATNSDFSSLSYLDISLIVSSERYPSDNGGSHSDVTGDLVQPLVDAIVQTHLIKDGVGDNVCADIGSESSPARSSDEPLLKHDVSCFILFPI